MTFLRANNVPLLPDEIPWPASSPDLSPIEHIWAHIKNRINTEHLQSREDLIREVNDIRYSDDTMALINKLMDTLRPRIWALEDLEGASLTGHQDMIRAYQHVESGQVSLEAARQHARTLINSHSVPSNWIETTEEKYNLILGNYQAATTAHERDFLLSVLAQTFINQYNELPVSPTLKAFWADRYRYVTPQQAFNDLMEQFVQEVPEPFADPQPDQADQSPDLDEAGQ
jgi:hypothetical protein